MRTRSRRSLPAALALIAASAAMTATPTQAQPAPDASHGGLQAVLWSGGAARAGAAPAPLRSAERQALISALQKSAAATAGRLGLTAGEKILVRDVIKDRDGTLHVRYDRTYAGMPVIGGDIVATHNADLSLRAGSKAHTASLANTPTTVSAPAGTARAKALAAAAAEGNSGTEAQAPRPSVWLTDTGARLVHETVIRGTHASGSPSELHVLTDAGTGEKLHHWDSVSHGTGETMYSGTVTLTTSSGPQGFQLTDPTRGNASTYDLGNSRLLPPVLFTSTADRWGNGTPASRQTAAADVHYGSAVVWDFYKNVMGRVGPRGDGSAPASRVHFGNHVTNASYDSGCFCVTYGDGPGNTKPMTSLDIVAHENTHALAHATAAFGYSGEASALDEATADIMSATIEFHTANPADPGDYLLAERVNVYGNGTPLRYMDRPSKDNWSRDYWEKGIGGMAAHLAAGPANHFFYLLSEGSGRKTVSGVSYDSSTIDGKPVAGIGRSKAALIWYRALTTRFTSTTNYASARTGTLAAAEDLYGAGSAEVRAVADAWAAVNVGTRS
ncbi:M4 family metallopeptidase [Streptomyces sp. NPDC047023]|uniref:M4 family metallopeptidase n=1 Tax=Streptomyces sp. NPDC047023 TaxID=3155139 RepID=UPI0033E085F5